MTERVVEFDCVECGRHIIRFIGEPDDRLCAICISMPGWFRYPELRELLDPDLKTEDLPEHERT